LNKFKKLIMPVIIVIIAAVVLYVFSSDDSGPEFRASTTGERGVSLLYDTLQYMGYPVGVSRNRVDMRTNINHAYIIIQPSYPLFFDEDIVNEKLEWIRMGGRLIFLQNQNNTAFDIALSNYATNFGSLRLYELGEGMLVTGRANDITNLNLMEEPNTGAILQIIIDIWGADRIMFGEYYHGPRPTDPLFNRMPIIVRLVFVQLALVAVMLVWYLGKRFGNPVVYYEEHEREENEHIHALTRLYMKIKRK